MTQSSDEDDKIEEVTPECIEVAVVERQEVPSQELTCHSVGEDQDKRPNEGESFEVVMSREDDVVDGLCIEMTVLNETFSDERCDVFRDEDQRCRPRRQHRDDGQVVFPDSRLAARVVRHAGGGV